MGREPGNDEIFEFLVYSIEVCQSGSIKGEHMPGYLGWVTLSPEATWLCAYVLHQYARSGTVKTEWLQSRIDTALVRLDIEFFKYMVGQELLIVGYELRKPQAALDAISIFFDRVKTDLPETDPQFKHIELNETEKA